MSYILMVRMVKVLQKKSILVFGINNILYFAKASKSTKAGFTLLELLITIAIIAMLSAIIVPNLQRATPRYEREAFVARFNTLVQYGWQQSLVTHKVQRITVDIGKKIITVQS